jgi:hypothetical protein
VPLDAPLALASLASPALRLDHDEDLDTLLSRVAAASRLVIDTGPGDLL